MNLISLLSMVLSVVGISIGWLPGVGWLGFGICAVAACMGIVGLSHRKISGSGLEEVEVRIDSQPGSTLIRYKRL